MDELGTRAPVTSAYDSLLDNSTKCAEEEAAGQPVKDLPMTCSYLME